MVKVPEGRWTIVGAIAGVVAAIIAAIALIGGSSGSPNGANSGTSTPRSSTPLGTSGAVEPPTFTPTDQGSAGIQPVWTGNVRVTADGINFIDVVPTKGVYVNDPSVSYQSDSRQLYIGGSTAALWTGSRDPSYGECVSLAKTQALSTDEQRSLPFRVGAGICMTWDQGAVFLRLPASDPGTPEVEVSATRWNATS